MSEEFGPDFITIIDEDGNEIELEYLHALEWNGNQYMAFIPAGALDEEPEKEAESKEEDDQGLILLKVVVEDGEELLSTLESEEELNAVYEQFMTVLFEDDEDE